MNKAAFLSLGSGLLLSLMTGFYYGRKVNKAQFDEAEHAALKAERSSWVPFIGIAVMVTGGFIFAAGKRQK